MSTQSDDELNGAEREHIQLQGGADRGLPTTTTGELGGAYPDIAGDVELGTQAARAAALTDPASQTSEGPGIAEARRDAVDQANNPPAPAPSTDFDRSRGILPTADLAGAADANPLEGTVGELENNTATGSGGLPDSSMRPAETFREFGAMAPPGGPSNSMQDTDLNSAADVNMQPGFSNTTASTTAGIGSIPDRGTAAGVGTATQGGAGGGTNTGDGGIQSRATDPTTPTT